MLRKTIRDLGITREDVTNGAMRRFVEEHDKARRVPEYVRAALKALDRYARAPGAVVDECKAIGDTR